MLSPMIMTSIWLSVPLLFLGIIRREWWLSAAITFLLLLLGVYRDALLVTDIWNLPFDLGLAEEGAILFLWMTLSFLWPVDFSISKIINARITSFVIGLILGQVAMTWFVMKQAKEKKSQVSLLFTGLAGAMLSPFGNLGLFGFSVTWKQWLLLIPIAMIAIFFSGRDEVRWDEGEKHSLLPLFLGAVIAIICSVFPEYSLFVLGGAALVLGVFRKAILVIPKTVFWILLFSYGAILIGTAGGAPELIAWGLEDSQFTYAAYIDAAVILCSTLASILVGEWNTALFFHAIQERALDVQDDSLWGLVGLGIATGGLSPFVWASCLRIAWKRVLVFFVSATILLLSLVVMS